MTEETGMFGKLNANVNASFIGKYFKMEERGTNFTTEFRGGVATFLTMAYILAVNPRILSESGGSCEYGPLSGADDDFYNDCVEEVKKQMIVSTALVSMVACLVMGLWANLPIALSCGMGMNAYFTYNVVGFKSFGTISYGAALVAVFIRLHLLCTCYYRCEKVYYPVDSRACSFGNSSCHWLLLGTPWLADC
jgi:AGZA family xanthine/uracil permease-like MFS transporter